MRHQYRLRKRSVHQQQDCCTVPQHHRQAAWRHGDYRDVAWAFGINHTEARLSARLSLHRCGSAHTAWCPCRYSGFSESWRSRVYSPLHYQFSKNEHKHQLRWLSNTCAAMRRPVTVTLCCWASTGPAVSRCQLYSSTNCHLCLSSWWRCDVQSSFAVTSTYTSTSSMTFMLSTLYSYWRRSTAFNISRSQPTSPVI